MKQNPITKNFLNLLGEEHGEELFNYLPDVQFFIKDLNGVFVMVNRGLLENYSLKDESEILGKTDFDLFPHYIATNFVKDDKLVFQGKKILNRIELVSRFDQSVDWFITNKIPLRSSKGEIVGLAAITREYLKITDSLSDTLGEIGKALEYIRKNYRKKIKLSKLAEIACLSESAFGRQFKKRFQIVPIQYIKTIRINAATQALIHSKDSLASIGTSVGFSDHSHFTREFVKTMGKTPADYRTEYLNSIKS